MIAQKKTIFIFLMIAVTVMSCKKDCEFVPVSASIVKFYQVVNNNEVLRSVDSIYIYPLVLPDSILYNWNRNVNTIRLPLSPIADRTDFVLYFNETVDTIEIFYKRQLYFVSEECGFSMSYILDSLKHTNNRIDSIKIKLPNVLPLNEEHIRLYF